MGLGEAAVQPCLVQPWVGKGVPWLVLGFTEGLRVWRERERGQQTP